MGVLEEINWADGNWHKSQCQKLRVGLGVVPTRCYRVGVYNVVCRRGRGEGGSAKKTFARVGIEESVDRKSA